MTKEFPHYFICIACAISNLAEPPTHAVTCHMGACPYCEQVGTLMAYTDFFWPWDSKESYEARWD